MNEWQASAKIGDRTTAYFAVGPLEYDTDVALEFSGECIVKSSL